MNDLAWWPQAERRPVTYYPEAGKFPNPVRGWVLHVAVMNGSPWSVFQNAPAGKRRFSHLWVAKDGHAEQYAPFDSKSWAMGAGNAEWLSVETEGFPDEPLTYAQLRTLAEFHAWSGMPDELAETPSGYGIGTHFMGGAAWGGHTCPDPKPGKGPRSRQRQAILDAAGPLKGQAVAAASTDTGGTDMPLTQDDLANITRAVWGATWRETAANGQEVPVDAGTRLARAARVPSADDIAAALAARIPTGGGAIDVRALAVAVADELHSRLAQ